MKKNTYNTHQQHFEAQTAYPSKIRIPKPNKPYISTKKGALI